MPQPHVINEVPQRQYRCKLHRGPELGHSESNSSFAQDVCERSCCRQGTSSARKQSVRGHSSLRGHWGARDLQPVNVHPAVEFVTSPKAARRRDPLYLFACKIEWRNHCNLTAFQELLAALDDPSDETRLIAESLLGRPSPRRKHSDL